MRRLKDAKVAMKLMLAFGSVTVLVLVLGIASSRTMFRLTEALGNSHESLVVPLIHEHTLRKEIYELRLAMLAFARNIGNPEAMAKFEAAALRQEETITRKGENLTALAKTPEELRLGKVWQGLWATCIEAHREVLRAGKAGQVDWAWQIIQGTGEHGARFGDHFTGMLDLAGQRMTLKQQESQAIVEHSKQQVDQMTFLVVGLCLGAVVLGVLLTFLITRALARPLVRMVAALQAFTGGDYSSRVAISAQDEVGQLGAAFNQMADRIQAQVSIEKQAQGEVQRLIDAAVEGRLSERAPAEHFEGFYRSLAEGINQMLDAFVDRLTQVVRAVKDSVESMAGGSVEISQGTEDLARRTSEQAAALEETSSAMEEMTSSVKQNADNAKQANQLATAARDVAEKGGSVTSRAMAAMSEINTSSKRIAEIITVIDEIAFQTNLLALNAAVEAARAGEHGRGFAVVAAEVRNLAQRSATAAKEIKGLINESVQRVTDGGELVVHSGKTLEEIVGAVKRVTDIFAEIAASSQEQAGGIDQVNKSIMQMDETTQQNAALVEESAAACQNLTAQATGLTRLMESFKMKDGRVVEMIAIEGQAEDDPAAWREGGVRSLSGAVPHRMSTATHQLGAKSAGSAAAHRGMVKKPSPQPKAAARKEPVGVAAGNGKERRRAEDEFEEF